MNFASIFKSEPTRQTFSAGEILIRQGESNDKMFIILSGELEVKVGGKAAALLKEGDLFGELSMIDKEPASGEVVAVTVGDAEQLGLASLFLALEPFLLALDAFDLESELAFASLEFLVLTNLPFQQSGHFVFFISSGENVSLLLLPS